MTRNQSRRFAALRFLPRHMLVNIDQFDRNRARLA
jgi:hypothetical protein